MVGATLKQLPEFEPTYQPTSSQTILCRRRRPQRSEDPESLRRSNARPRKQKNKYPPRADINKARQQKLGILSREMGVEAGNKYRGAAKLGRKRRDQREGARRRGEGDGLVGSDAGNTKLIAGGEQIFWTNRERKAKGKKSRRRIYLSDTALR